MSSNRSLFLHIGLPKTATTYLQQQIFEKLQSIDYLDKPRSSMFRGVHDAEYGILDRCFKRSAVVWRERGDEVFGELLGRERDHEVSRSLLISDEGIGTLGRKPFFLRVHFEEFARKATEWGFSDVRVICTFRRQDQWLGSHYAQISDRVPGASQGDFEEFVSRWLQPSVNYYRDGMLLNYKVLRDQLVVAVGEENILMLPYELLAADSAAYLSRIVGFLGVEDDAAHLYSGSSRDERSNVRSSRSDVWALRKRGLAGCRVLRLRPGRLFRGLGLPSQIPLRLPELGRGKFIEMTDELKGKVLETYEQSNRELAADLHVELRQYGYF